jgi:transposase
LENITKNAQDTSPTQKLKSTSEPNPEVKPARQHRKFPASYKLKILEELDRCINPGDKGMVARREGLYSSQISDWRRLRREGTLTALNKARGRKKKRDTKDEKISTLEAELNALKNKLNQAEVIIDIQKKVSEMFGISNPKAKSSGSE